MELTGDSKSKNASVRNNRARARTGAAAVARLIRCLIIRLPKSFPCSRVQTFHDLAPITAMKDHESLPDDRRAPKSSALLHLPEHTRTTFRQIVKEMRLRRCCIVGRAEEARRIGILRVCEQRQGDRQRDLDAEQLLHDRGVYHVELSEA